MTMDMLFARKILNLTRDIVFAALYFGFPKAKDNGRARRTLGIASLLALYAFYNAEAGGFFYSAAVQLFWRFLTFFTCVSLYRDEPFTVNLYHALFFNSVCTLSHNLFLTPVSRPVLLLNHVFVSTPWINNLLSLLIINAVTISVYLVVLIAAPYDEDREVHPFQVLLLLAILMITVYSNQTLRILTDTARVYTKELSIYSIVQQVGMLFCLVLMERERMQAREGIHAYLQMVYAKGALRMVEQQQQRDERLHALWHDMKNHILSIRYLVKQGDHEASLAYMDRLLSEGERDENEYETGIPMLNGLLASKMNEPVRNGVRADIFCDLRALGRIQDVDLCIIFGNALDNALEALRKMESGKDRYIYMRAQQVGAYLVVTLANPCMPTESLRKSGLPRTTKEDKRYHGIGLHNVQRAMEKYGGVMEIEYDPVRPEFKLILMFPLAAEIPA